MRALEFLENPPEKLVFENNPKENRHQKIEPVSGF
jgi:hypothetical protein